ncbi:MAG: Hsp70 family protein [Thermodesulfobacteriota bacterium]
MKYTAGIDLGTTNSEIALIIDNHTEIIKNDDDGIFPSCIGFDTENNLLTGRPALNQALLYPEKTIRSAKRYMGTDKVFKIGDNEFTPVEVSAIILQELKKRAEKKTGKKIDQAVITVPAYFKDSQRHATKEAGEIAGFKVKRIINEPTAAALAYEQDNESSKNIIVYDLGGGTFDVSVVKIEKGVVEVLSTAGNSLLGGDDFDKRLKDHFCQIINEKHNIDVSKDKIVSSRLLYAAEQAKKTLSKEAFVNIEEDYIAKKDEKDIHFSLELSRLDFESIIEDYLRETISLVSKAVSESGLLIKNIDRIVLAGGSTRIPAVSDLLEDKFSITPDSGIDPDLCVATGAAIQAGREMGLDSLSLLLDITPYSFGTSALTFENIFSAKEIFVPIIKKNSKLPVSMTKSFVTIADGQEATEIRVYQGENENPEDNILIGDYFFELSELPAQSIITIKFDLDLNGILKIEAEEKETGKKLKKSIKNAFPESSEEVIELTSEKINSLTVTNEDEDHSQQQFSGIPPEIEITLKKAEKLKTYADEEDSQEIEELINKIKDAVFENDIEKAEEAAEELDDILFYFE